MSWLSSKAATIYVGALLHHDSLRCCQQDVHLQNSLNVHLAVAACQSSEPLMSVHSLSMCVMH